MFSIIVIPLLMIANTTDPEIHTFDHNTLVEDPLAGNLSPHNAFIIRPQMGRANQVEYEALLGIKASMVTLNTNDLTLQLDAEAGGNIFLLQKKMYFPLQT